jgi:hypothetical protein
MRTDPIEDSSSMNNTSNVFEAIKSGQAKMRPRWYFVAQTGLAIAAVVLMFALLLFFVSFIIFVLQQDGGLFATHFGFMGWYSFFRALPWTILLLSLALILILAVLLKRYAFVYHQPFLYLLLVLIVVISLTSFFLAATSFHRGVLHSNLPLIGDVYHYEMTTPQDVYRGQITSLFSNGFIIENAIGQTSTIIIASDTPLSITNFKIGDTVIIFGRNESTATIEIFGAQKTSPF